MCLEVLDIRYGAPPCTVVDAQVTQQAMNYAIRSGIAITGGYALSQCSRLLKTQDDPQTEELQRLQNLLDNKIRIISPAIDMIELIAARGNSSLESALTLTKSLRQDIQNLGIKLSKAAEDGEFRNNQSTKGRAKVDQQAEIQQIVADLKTLLQKIEDAVPLINLAITTSGVTLSSALPVSVSPSRLLQASVFLSGGDAQYHTNPSKPVQVGPCFTMSMYMLFSGHAARAGNEQHFRSTIWKEVIHKAHVKLVRTAIPRIYDFPFLGLSKIVETGAAADEFAYQLLLVEDLDDDRFHDETSPQPFDDIENAGIREVLPVHEISKIFYADTGKVLNLGANDATNNPVLLLKRDPNGHPPRRMTTSEMSNSTSEDSDAKENEGANLSSAPKQQPTSSKKSGLPSGLDPEWIAFEVYSENIADPDCDGDSESDTDFHEMPNVKSRPPQNYRSSSAERRTLAEFSHLSLDSSPPESFDRSKLSKDLPDAKIQEGQSWFSLPMNIRTSLSLLEMLLRLASLQQFQQASHLTINDELLNFFLEESRTTGAAVGDVDARKRVRMEARQRVGFDPYDESPVRRSARTGSDNSTNASPLPRKDYRGLSRQVTENTQSSPIQSNTSKDGGVGEVATDAGSTEIRSLPNSPLASK